MIPKTGILSFILTMALLIGSVPAQDAGAHRMVVEGTVRESGSGEPVGSATVRLVGTSQSTMANEEGRFRIVISGPERSLKFSHIAFYSEQINLADSVSTPTLDIFLKRSVTVVSGLSVYARRYDPGQQIIVEAIRRKQDILNRIHDYRYDAYTKLVVNDETGDTSKIMLITETQTTAFWEQPDRYKEIITSRRQSANINPEDNLVSVGELLNFNLNRIEVGRYSVVSPTAEDALDHYNYYLLDTMYVDSMAVFRLEVEPKNPDDPLFVGFIHIADSTYDVVEVDVGFSRGVDFSLMKNLWYSQRLARFDERYWMPTEIRFGGTVELAMPGIPNRLSFEHVAVLSSFLFDAGHPDNTFDEYVVEVIETADEFDSTAWQARTSLPLTGIESQAYDRLDSLENLPMTAGRMVKSVLAASAYLFIIGNDNFFRYNRVEGAYLGLGGEIKRLLPHTRIRFGGGYAVAAERSQYRWGVTYRLHQRRRLDFGFDYTNGIRPREVIITGDNYNPTFFALTSEYNSFDYYRTRGVRFFASAKLFHRTKLGMSYEAAEQFSAPVSTAYSFFGDGEARENPTVAEGRLRLLAAELSYDSRPKFNNKGEEILIDETQQLQLTLGIESADPGLVDNDFDFRRYYFKARRTQRTLGIGMTSVSLYAGGSEGALPPQRYHTVDFGNAYLSIGEGFFTLGERNFSGDRMLMMVGSHDFRRRLQIVSGLPLIRRIPFWFSIHGGVFWSEFKNRAEAVSARPYRELGFGVGNLTPFWTPLNLKMYFTWQLSDYATNDFSATFGFEL